MLIPDLERDLVEAARRLPDRRGSARRLIAPLAAASAAVAVIALLLLDAREDGPASAPASEAPGAYSTGVRAADALIAIEGGPGRQPGPGGAAEALDTPGITRPAKTVVYASRNGLICVVSAEPRPPGGARGSYPNCQTLEGLLRSLERKPLQTGGWVESTDEKVYSGYAAGNVAAIRALGDSDLTIRLSPPWTPMLDGARPLRHFVIVDDGRPPPPVEIIFEDGRTVRAELR